MSNLTVFHFSHIINDVMNMFESDPFYSRLAFTKDKCAYDMTAFDYEFTRTYTVALDVEAYASFKNFCVSIMTHQGSMNVHPLTCGVNSNHALLVPRIILPEATHILVCPTCGYVQSCLPPMFR